MSFNKYLIALFLLLPQSSFAYERIVTLAPVLSEWTAIILGEKAANDKIVGVSEYSQYPDFLKKKTEVGPYPRINIERVAALHPDLIIASSVYNRLDQIEQLKRLHLPVRILKAEKFSEMGTWIESLGEVLGEKAGALKAKKEWDDGVSAIRRKAGPRVRQRRVFIEVQHQPLISVGGESFLSDAFGLAGYQNVYKDLKQDYPKVSKESVLKENPQVIFVLSLMGDQADFKSVEKDWQNFPSLTAVSTKQIHPISADDFARCSLRLLKALKELN